jgi:uncharacterized protein YodC (DUF2158 family)
MHTGDVVKLKSGGPFMTVNSVVDNDVQCIWFHEDSTVEMYSFKFDCLEQVCNEELCDHAKNV